MATATFQSILPKIVPFECPRPLERLLARALGIDQLGDLHVALQQQCDDRPIADRLLEVLSVTTSVPESDLARIPKTGPAIVTVNHPFGILEGAVLSASLGAIRNDVRVLANRILATIPEVRSMLISVDPISGRKAVTANSSGLRKALDHLGQGGILVIFPAGEVSHFQWRDRAVTDSEWNPLVARLVQIAAHRGVRVPVIPAYVKGANSMVFQLGGMLHPGLRTALLGRELLNKRGSCVEVRFGAAIDPAKLLSIPCAHEQARYLRWRTYMLSRRFKAHTRLPLKRHKIETQPVAPQWPVDTIVSEIASLPAECLLNRSGDLEVYLTSAPAIPNTLHEIGRLREITFRAAGEGTGKALDLDEFDPHYLHLFVWNAVKQEIVGAYRLARTDQVQSLYTSTLFRYDQPFLNRLGPSIELGRSFIRQEYQRSFAPLLLLWKGIGAYITAHPQCKILFGPVSISDQYGAASRELMVAFLEKYAWLRDWAGLVRNRNRQPARLLKGAQRPVLPDAGVDMDDLSTMIGEIEENNAGVPVLLRHYLKLGGKLLGFNVDPSFANALDGLILVDLSKTEPRLLDRYLGRTAATAFLEFQKGQNINGTH